MRLVRRKETESVAEEAEPAITDPQILELAELTSRVLADVASEGEEPLAEGALHTRANDLVYMRVTDQHIVYSSVTGSTIIVRTSDARAFDTDPPIEVKGVGPTVVALLRAHHPSEPENITRSYTFRFPAESPLIGAIRTACDIPEPEEPAEETEEEDEEAES
jgi:hypothetical protein